MSGRSPGEGNGNLLQYSCLGNPMDRGSWWAIVHGVARVGHNLATKQQYSFVYIYMHDIFLGFSGGSDGKESACSVGDLGSIPGSGRSSGGGHGNPLLILA